MKREASYCIGSYLYNYINYFKFCSFKKQKIKGSKVKKLCKQVRNQKYGNKLMMKLNSWYRLKFNSKAFAIPILTATK